MPKVIALLDTNVFLHFQAFDHVKWTEELGADEVELVIAPVVIRELDDKKDSHKYSKIQDRARKALKRIEGLAEAGASEGLPRGVTLTIAREPQLSFEEHGLRESTNDDHLIACALDRKSSDTESEVVVVSNDTGPRIKARQHSIRALEPNRELMLPSAVEGAEKEKQQLLRRLKELEGGMPDLKLLFSSGKDFLKVILPEEVQYDESLIEKELERIKAEYPKLYPTSKPPDESNSLRRSIVIALGEGALQRDQPPPQEYDRYNTALEEYYASYEKYLKDSHNLQAMESNMVSLDIVVLNTGGAPATDIEIAMHFPDGFLLVAEDDLPTKFNPPRPPRKPMTSMEMLLNLPNLAPSIDPSRLTHLGLPPMRSNVSGPDIRETNSYEVVVAVGKLKHKDEERLDRLCVIFPSREQVKSFEIDCAIKSDNTPNDVKRVLRVVVD